MKKNPGMIRIGANGQKLLALAAIVAAAVLLFQFVDVDMRHFNYAMKIRAPKLMVILISAFCIGSATIVFQSIINNTIVTPCLLGMNALYILIHTTIVFVFGSMSVITTTKWVSFSLDLAVMGGAAVLIYGYLFKKTGGNVLYILLAGTVMATLFSNVTSALQRIMDPNEYQTLMNALIASFHKVNADIIVISLVLIGALILILRGEIALLDVIALGKDQAVNLGVDYDKTVRRLLLGVTLLIAVATAMVGPISFLGLIIANLSRQLFSTFRHAILIFGSAFIGMAVLLTGQALIEHVFSFSVNIGVFINVGGGAYFLYLLLRNGGKNAN
ncbi:MAG: iron chelate uptake ABC transporter family permease subunit [Synergistaceae bacterium]|jgi:iron complex transport system permease protein|nr:iron chelate uptake ABC transporter family permease subunit [Synergistaceae bacterium]